MDEQRSELLNEEIKSRIEGLSGLEPGSKEETVAVDNLVKLYNVSIEETKVGSELDEKALKRYDEKEHQERELELREEEIKSKVKTDIIKTAVEAGVSGVSFAGAWYWLNKSFKFEETGSITSGPGRNLVQSVVRVFKFK